MSRLFTILITFSVFPSICFPQEAEKPKSYDLNGYVSFLQTNLMDDYWLTNNQIHNRINYTHYISEKLTFKSGLRNRILYGDNNKLMPNYADQFEADNGIFDLTTVPLSDQSWFFTSQADRLFFEYTIKKIQISVGRQRINWSQCTVWNPNDIFNTYSYYDFDYVERSGADAVRFVYYRNYASQLEFVCKANADEKLSFASLYKFNKWNYDIQLIGGVLDEQDYTLGAGTMGYIGANSLRSELTYLHPMENEQDTTGVTLFSIGMDRLCKKDLFLQVEFLYNSSGDSFDEMALASMYTEPQSVKSLSFEKYSFFAGAQIPVTPLFQVGLSGMYYTKSETIFLSPNFVYSLKDNLDISLTGQYFKMETDNVVLASWTLKQSF